MPAHRTAAVVHFSSLHSEDEGDDGFPVAGVLGELASVVAVLAQRPHTHLVEAQTREQQRRHTLRHHTTAAAQPHQLRDAVVQLGKKEYPFIYSYLSHYTGDSSIRPTRINLASMV